MGKRIRTTIDLILMGLVCIVLALSGEYQILALLMAVMGGSLAAQCFRVWRYMRRKEREYETLMPVRQEGDA